FHAGQMQYIVQLQHSEWLVLYPDHLFSRWIQFIYYTPAVATSLWWAATLLELIFLLGFFTKRFDRWLFIAFCLFLLSDYFVMGLHFWELGVFAVFFLPKIRQYLD